MFMLVFPARIAKRIPPSRSDKVDRDNLAGVVSSHSDGDESILAGLSPQ